jgi:transposase
LHAYRHDPDPPRRCRAPLLLLRDDGYPGALSTLRLYTSSSTRARWQQRYTAGGRAALRGQPPGRPGRAGCWAALVVGGVRTRAPADFGFARSRWSCAAVAVILTEDEGTPTSRETVRRWLGRAGLVWRRPRPVPRPRDSQRAAKLRTLRALLHDLAADETAVFRDEVEIHTNPQLGCLGMRRGQQAVVATPGTNAKRVLAGSIHWRTGRVLLTEGRPKQGREAALFCRHGDDLRRAFRH